MKSVSFQKRPPKDNPTVDSSNFRYYIQNYGLALEKLRFACNSKNSDKYFNKFKLHVGEILDPLASRGGHKRLVKNVERELSLIDEPGVWDGKEIRVKTIVQSTGCSGGVIRRESNAELCTFAGVGSDSGVLPEETVNVPIEGKISDPNKLELWRGSFGQRYAEPSKGDFFDLGISPTGSGRFRFHFKTGSI
jgi:hypothetical protein